MVRLEEICSKSDDFSKEYPVIQYEILTLMRIFIDYMLMSKIIFASQI